MKYILLILSPFLTYSLYAQCTSSDVYDVEDANAYCFEIDGNVRHIYANNYPDHDDDYNQQQFTLAAGDYEYFMCAYPEQAVEFTPLYEEEETTVGCEYNYQFGVSINGVRYDPSSAVTFENSDGSNNLDWHVEATAVTNDIGINMGEMNGGHLNPSGEYHYHTVPYDYFTSDLGIDGSEHSPIVGYAADGFPIYYKYVYTDSEDALSAITTVSSGYTLKSGDRPGDGDTAPDQAYDGNYYEDYEYSSTNTILDECNGRYAVTPDYPYGTYYYVITDEYPYIPRCFKGTHADDSFRVGPTAACSPSSETTAAACASEISGCMDPFSDNYNSNATVDDGTCTYSAVTWNDAWSNTSGPGDGNNVVIATDYVFSSDGQFSCTNLTVSTGATLTVDTEEALVVFGDLVNNGSIVVASGGSLITYSDQSISGNDITIKRNTRYADGKYSFVGTPMNQSSTITGADLGSFVYKYNETTGYADQGLNRWEDASTDQLVPGKGYTQAFQQEISFVGTPNSGDISIEGTFTDRTNDNVEGWVFVSNPYPAAISVQRFINENTNLTGSVYFWDDNNSQSARGSNADYIVANGMATTQSSSAGNQDRYNQHIGSAQGFFVKLLDDTNLTVNFTEEMRVSDSNADDHYFRTADVPLLRINLADAAGLFKQAVVGWVPGIADEEVNRLYDAPAFNYSADQAIYSMKLDRAWSIQGISSSREEVLLGYNVDSSGDYQLTLEGEGSVDQSVYVLDQMTGEEISLNRPYSFYSQAGSFKDRFVLVTNRSVLGAETEGLIYSYQKQLYVRLKEGMSSVLRVYSLTGQQVLEQSVGGSSQIDLSHLSNGVYLVSDGLNMVKIALK